MSDLPGKIGPYQILKRLGAGVESRYNAFPAPLGVSENLSVTCRIRS
jgi:hypothetical protein